MRDKFFYIICNKKIASDSIKRNLEAWYLAKAKYFFEFLMQQCGEKSGDLNFKPLILKVRKMKTHCDSLSLKIRTMTLNSELIKTPKECIEYVIFHEFCHLKHRLYNVKFYRLLEQLLTDWKERKTKLKKHYSRNSKQAIIMMLT